jgi:hypothetical protein
LYRSIAINWLSTQKRLEANNKTYLDHMQWVMHMGQAPDSLSLLDPSRTAGPDMPIATFCTRYELGDLILRKLIDNGYSHACMLRFVQITELTQMEFRLGDIAAMKDAVEQWSVSTGN